MLIYRFAVALPWRIVDVAASRRQGLRAPAVRPIYDAAACRMVCFDRPRRSGFDDRAVVVERD
jgi:hypothetical protein